MRDLRQTGAEDHVAEERRAHHAERVLANRQRVCVYACLIKEIPCEIVFRELLKMRRR